MERDISRHWLKEYLTPQGFFAGLIVSFILWTTTEIYSIKEVRAARYTEQQVTQIYNDKINDWVEQDGKQILVTLGRIETNITHIQTNLGEMSGVVDGMVGGSNFNHSIHSLGHLNETPIK